MKKTEIEDGIKRAEDEVARLKSLGWEKADFVAALKDLYGDERAVIPREHDVVRLKRDCAGVASGSEGTVVNVYSPTEETVEVEFEDGNVISVLARWLDITWMIADRSGDERAETAGLQPDEEFP